MSSILETKENPSFVVMHDEVALPIENQKENLNDLKPMSFDEILSEKIGFGKFQYIAIALMSMISITDGAEALLLSFLSPVLETEWGISRFQQSLLGSSVFMGFFVGCILSGQLGDRYGRRRPLVIGVFLNFFFGFLSGLATNFTMLAIFRAFFGCAVGIISPLASTLLSEITPKHIRGRVLVFYSLFFTLGELLTVLVAFLTLNDLNSGNWRALIVWSSIPGIITFIFCYFYLEESPRYLLACQKFNSFFPLVNKIIKINQKNSNLNPNPNTHIYLTQTEILRLTKYGESQQDHEGEKVGNPKELFHGEKKRITPLIWIMWYVLSCVYYGIIFILPEILKRKDLLHKSDDNQESVNEFLDIAFSVFSELPSSLLTFLIIEVEFLGRKNSITVTFFLTAVACLFAFCYPFSMFLLAATMARFFLNITFLIIYPFTTEIYSTKIRATGLGLASACSRVGGITMPWISYGAFVFGTTGPFLVYGVMSGVAFSASLGIPYDTTGRELDKEEDGVGKKGEEKEEGERREGGGKDEKGRREGGGGGKEEEGRIKEEDKEGIKENATEG